MVKVEKYFQRLRIDEDGQNRYFWLTLDWKVEKKCKRIGKVDIKLLLFLEDMSQYVENLREFNIKFLE